mmetsp:Transcript_12094/g.15831  ORF Transcript_12094/g.15831 Transcript_12094/m.15831 type:complete len:415 (+) Transcript_12094:79-1323(+)
METNNAAIIAHCQRCGIEASPTQNIRACTRCYTVGYCGRSCQRADWSGNDGHKSNCRPPKEEEYNSEIVTRLEVKRSDQDEWEDVGPINLVQDNMTTSASIIDDSANINPRPKSAHTTKPNVQTKELPQRTQQILHSSSELYKYQHSHDGVDENLLIFFHGAGDSHLPFDALGRRMELPQTATLSLSASLSLNSSGTEGGGSSGKTSTFVELPFGLGHTWFQEMDYTTGDTLSMNHPSRLTSLKHALKILDPLLCSLIGMYEKKNDNDNACEENDASWIPERIFLFGFSAGACLAMELCRMWRNAGRMPLGGAICICGGSHARDELLGMNRKNDKSKQYTDVLIITGEKDYVYSQKAAELSKQLYDPSKVQIYNQKGKGHTMIDSREEMQVIMEFLSKRLVRRMVSMEGQSRDG